MSDQGEKTCPLCAEEMDLTDQQLKPCKCGYEICVWCWHHIIDMAEKDDTEGRCPACRIPYDKEKIVGMASNERLADIQSERKLKSQKPKPKASDGRKHLSSVRVIQRNLVYIIGIPSNLADEDLLQRREYFAQYGKVLKVSIARTAGGAIQHSPNNTCSVYITYSKEEEAVRCIQLVHGYVLEGKPLRACFGTTKYCHAWLRNMTCSNPDCLYLHEIGTQEDSFTKDEIISAYTRVQQITGATNNLQRRSGNTLPPPMDDFCVNTTAPSAKPIAKITTNNPVSHPKGSPPNGSSGRSVTLPAAASWGLRVSNGRPPTASSTGLSEPAGQRVDTSNGLSTAVTGNIIQGSTLYSDVGINSSENEESQVQHSNGGLGQLESSKQCSGKDVQETASDSLAEVVRKVVPATTTSRGQLPFTYKDSDRGLRMQPNITQTEELGRQSHASSSDANVTTNGIIQSISSTLSSMGIDSHSGSGNSDVIKPHISDYDILLTKSSGHHASQQYNTEHVREPLISLQPRKAPVESDGVSDSREFSDLRSESQSQSQSLANTYSGVEEILLRSDDRRCNKSDGVTGNVFGITGLVDSGHEEVDPTSSLFLSRKSVLPNGYDESKVSRNSELGKISGSSNLLVNVEKGEYSGRLNKTAFDMNAAGTDMGENSIISNILSMDFDAWDDSLTSPHNLVKLLSKTDKQHNSLKLSSSLKVQNNNQSRFSFAREDLANPVSDLDNSFNNLGHNKYSVPQDYTVDRDPYSEKLRNGFTSSMFAETDTFPSNLSLASSNKLAASRSQISAPPGFSIPSRAPAPPPGFSTQERMEQTFESFSGNHLLESSMLRNQYLAQTGGVADVELIDPAILAVGKGRVPNGISNSGLDMRSTYTPQLSLPESDPRLQILMQQSISQHQNLRYPDHNADRFSALSDAYRVQSRYLEQTQANNLSPFRQSSLQQSRNAHMLNGHWDEVHTSNELSMTELLRNERLGLNKHYSSYEDQKFCMPSSGDIYKRAYGI